MSEAEQQLDFQLPELPDGWAWVDLGDLALARLGKTPRKQDYRSDGGHKIIKFRDVKEGGAIDWTKDDKGFVDSDEGVLRTLRKIDENDVLVTASAHMSEHIGKKVGLVSNVPRVHENAYVVGEILQIRALDKVLPKWLMYFLQSSDGYKAIQRRVHGVHLIGSRAQKIEIPVAPVDQQKVIVAEIEKQFSRLDEAVANLKRVKANLKRYKAAVLKAAVEGKLTEEWRKQNTDVEPASKLLERILAERRTKWEEAELAKMKAKGKEPKNDKWKEKYKPPPTVDTEDLPELPRGWAWSNLEQLAEAKPHALKAGPFGSALKKSFYVKEGYKIYGQEQVIRGDAYYGDYYIDEDRYQSLISCSVKPGDLLVSLVGTIGRVLILPDDIEPGIINPRLVKVSLDYRVIFPEFLSAYLGSPLVKAIFSIASHGGTMDVLNLTILKSVPIPVPPKEEQQFVLLEIERIETLELNLEQSVSQSSQRGIGLRSSVLKDAFSGALGE